MQNKSPETKPNAGETTTDTGEKKVTPLKQAQDMPKEIGGPAGPEPTRYGDWEQKGRCSDF